MMVSCNEKKPFDGYLYPIRENGLYGFIDSVGNRIIEPEFLWVSTFHNGLAMAVVDTIYREVPDSMAYEVGERDTIINLYRMYAKYGYINKSGKFVIEPKFVSYVTMPEIGFVAKDIDDCSNALYRHSFRNGRAMFCDTITWKDGYIDTKGNIAIEAKYYYSEPFSDGVAVVRDAIADPIFTNGACINPSKLRCAYIDTLGNNVTEFKYETLTRCLSKRGIGTYKVVHKESVELGDTTVQIEEYREPRFLVNNCGNEIKELDFVFKYYGYSRDGITVALHDFLWKIGGNKEFFYFDKDGNRIEPLQGLSEYQLDSLSRCNDIIQVLPDNAVISETTFFNEGFAGISPDGKHWFVIDKYLLIHGYGDESIFDDFRAFDNGLAAVKRNGKWGYINKKIEEQIPCKYDSCGFVYPYLEEVFEYNSQGDVKKKAYINRKDSLIWESLLYDSEKIENRYSIKENKDYGKWAYEYNPLSKHLIFMITGVVLFLLIAICFIWKSVSNKSSKGQNLEELIVQNEPKNEVVTDADLSNYNEDDIDEILTYPTVGQYTEAIKESAKAPDEYFDRLKHLRPVLDGNGEPIMSSGNFAVVFKMKDEYGKQYAVRCFHRAQQGREKNYKLICEELAKVSSPYLSPIKYYEKELFVDSGEYPVLLMDWVEGMTLDKYIRKVIDDKKALSKLAINFKNLAIWLLNQPFAHGDLKPDNILVMEDGSLVLVDYDGMFVPAMQGQKAREIGSPDFRNPSRTDDNFDKEIDNFSIISILLSLELLVENKDYLSRYGAKDRLLFSEKDYIDIENCMIYKYAFVSHNSLISELAITIRKLIIGIFINNNYIIALLKKDRDQSTNHSNNFIDNIIISIFLSFFTAQILFSLILRSFYGWNILYISSTILLSIIIMYSIIVVLDIFRPNKEELIAIFDEEGPGCFAFIIALLPILMMGDFFTDWINDLGLPLVSNLPQYDNKWYITTIIWVLSFFIIVFYTYTPYYLFSFRLNIYMTPEEKRIKALQEEKDRIQKQINDEEEKRKKQSSNHYFYDDLPFNYDDNYYDDYDYYYYDD